MIDRRHLIAIAASFAGLALTEALPVSVATASTALRTQRTHNEIIAAILKLDEPEADAPHEVRLLWMLVRCTPDELDFLEVFVDAAVAHSSDELPGADGARFLIAMARPEPNAA